METGTSLVTRHLRPSCRLRHDRVGFLDPGGEQLDADPDRARHPGGHRVSGGLVGHRVQSELPLSVRAHDVGGLSHDLGGRAGSRRQVQRTSFLFDVYIETDMRVLRQR